MSALHVYMPIQFVMPKLHKIKQNQVNTNLSSFATTKVFENATYSAGLNLGSWVTELSFVLAYICAFCTPVWVNICMCTLAKVYFFVPKD